MVGPKGDRINDNYTMTAVHEVDDVIFCGGIDGRLHLVKRDALNSE